MQFYNFTILQSYIFTILQFYHFAVDREWQHILQLCIYNFAILQLCNFTILQWTENGNTWDFICQHGPDECFGNKVQVDFVILLMLSTLISIKHLGSYFGIKSQVLMIVMMIALIMMILTMLKLGLNVFYKLHLHIKNVSCILYFMLQKSNNRYIIPISHRNDNTYIYVAGLYPGPPAI